MKNTVSRWVCCLMTAMMVTGLMAPEAVADADKDAKRESRRMQAQLSAAQKEKAVLAAQVEDLKKQLGELGSKSVALEKKSGGQRKQFTELTEKYQETDKNLQLMTQQYSDTSKALQQLQAEKEKEQKQLSGDVRVCEKKNAELYQVSVELMEEYQAKGIFTSLLQAEPFTQLEKVRVQNLLQEYRDKAEAAKIASAKVSVGLPANDASVSASGTPPVSSPGEATSANAPAKSSGNEPAAATTMNTASADAHSNVAPVSAVASDSPANTPSPTGDVVTGASSSAAATTTSNNAQDVPRP